jgi:hypothetical protein
MTESAADTTTDSRRGAGPRRIGRRGTVLAAATVALLALSFGSVALAASGKLTQKAGTDGCISAGGSGGATADGAALDGA